MAERNEANPDLSTEALVHFSKAQKELLLTLRALLDMVLELQERRHHGKEHQKRDPKTLGFQSLRSLTEVLVDRMADLVGIVRTDEYKRKALLSIRRSLEKEIRKVKDEEGELANLKGEALASVVQVLDRQMGKLSSDQQRQKESSLRKVEIG